MVMWRQEKKRNNLSLILIASEIGVIAIVILAFLNFLWQNTQIRYADQSLQIVFVGLFALLIITVASGILSRRW